MVHPETTRAPTEPRRGIIMKLSAVVMGIPVLALPLAATLGALLDPLRRKKAAGREFVFVARLNALPTDGQPRRFSVVAERQDAWNRYPPAPMGAVFVRRERPDAPPRAYSAVCPHLGCSVDFKPERNRYQCPCHNSMWDDQAQRIDPDRCPSPRDLDELEVEIRSGDQIWVRYVRFRSGIAQKVAE
jgi:menaquinol-cytochrome c reductase iron-sulfur subunit